MTGVRASVGSVKSAGVVGWNTVEQLHLLLSSLESECCGKLSC
jgi:hypothetical protein